MPAPEDEPPAPPEIFPSYEAAPVDPPILQLSPPQFPLLPPTAPLPDELKVPSGPDVFVVTAF